MELITNRRLKKFLIEKDILERFTKNFINNLNEKPDKLKSDKLTLLNHEDNSYIFVDAFAWNQTPEGARFWQKIAKEYRDKIHG